MDTRLDDRDLWLPPRRLRRYQWLKIFGAMVMTAIFIGWMAVRWSSPTVRWLCGGMIVVTLWIVAVSVCRDIVRQRGRQLAIHEGHLLITTPQAESRVALNQVAQAQWRDEPAHEVGLWLFDREENVLAHIDAAFVADQHEARALLHWARQRAMLDFPVRWPGL